MPYARKRVSKRPRGKRAAPKRNRAVSTATKVYVKKLLHSQIENKMILTYAANQNMITAGPTNASYINLLPVITQGTGVSNRVGNEVRVVSGILKGYVNLLPYNAVSNPTVAPLYIKMWLFSMKTINSTAVTAGTLANFFSVNNAGAGFQGSILDMMLPVNADLVTVYATKVINIGTTYSAYGNSDNSRFSQAFSFDWGKHFKSVLKFDDASTFVTNRNCFLLFSPCTADGASVSTIPAEYHYTNTTKYEDA